ncbi:hypothetical protein Tco_1221778 [Tanacetum coccineum]
MLEFCGDKVMFEEKPNVQGIGHRWMFDLDYLTDSMNYIPVSLQNQANPAGSKEVIDIDVQTKEAEQIHLDALLAQRIAEEEELTEQQKKRKAQVQFEAQHYTNEDWDLIRAKLEANAELSKSMLGSELVNQS